MPEADLSGEGPALEETIQIAKWMRKGLDQTLRHL
jgi:hypothetical protein